MNKLEKFRKAVEKKDRYNIGVNHIPDWISTGNAGLNNIISGDMTRGFAVGRTSAIAGLNGTGKSFLAANAIREAQAKDYFAIYVDTEHATGEGFLEKIGVDMSEDRFMAVNTSIIEEVIEFTSDLFKHTDKEDKIILVIDSLSNLQPSKDVEKFEDGKQAFGQGLREKMLKLLVNNLNSHCGNRNMLILFTCHMYVNGTDAYGNPILKPNVGEGTLFIPSSVVQVSKKDLKDGKEIAGIQVKCKMLKTRFTRHSSTCEFDLPWDTGMDFYDGSLEVLEESDFLTKNGGWYSYTDRETGETIKFQKSNYDDHRDKLIGYYSDQSDEIEEKDEVDAHLEYLGKETETEE